jgi:hypothetical protein
MAVSLHDHNSPSSFRVTLSINGRDFLRDGREK